jgi:hypothetical protein
MLAVRVLSFCRLGHALWFEPRQLEILQRGLFLAFFAFVSYSCTSAPLRRML